MDHFWLSDVQLAAIEPHIPRVHTGKRRVADRRLISGIVHQSREGCRWRTLPEAYGPYTTLFNRYNRWSKRGLWQTIFAALVEIGDPPDTAKIDSSSVKAHRSASGTQKGGAAPGDRPIARRMHDQNPPPYRRGRPPHVLHLTTGQPSDIITAAELIAQSRPSARLLADRL